MEQTVTLSKPQYFFERENDSVMTRTMDGMIKFWNQSAEKLYGWKKEEALGRVSHDLLRTQFPKPLKEIESELVRNGRWEGKLVHTTRDGALLVVESQWTLDLNGQSGPVVEINAPSAEPGARTDADTLAIGRQAEGKLMKPDDLLPKIASIVLAGGAFLCLVVLLYFFYYYGWTAQRSFSRPLGMVVYYGLPAGMAILLFSFLRRSPEFKVNAALLCLSLTMSAYAGELLLRLTDSTLLSPAKPVMADVLTSKEKKKEAAKLTEKFGVEIDTRGGFEVIADLRKGGIDAVPIITPSNHLFVDQPDGSIKSAINIHGNEVLPFGGISNKVTVLCNESGEWITYQSDAHGFQNPSGMWKSGRIDIAALGDSFAQGYCVPSDKNFVALIRRGYPATLNLGMAGNGPLLMLATLKEYLPLYKPKVVLWFYFEGNDLTDLRTEKKSGILMRYLKDDFSQGLLAQQSDIDQSLANEIDREKALEKANQARREKNTSRLSGTLLEFVKLPSLRGKLSLVYGVDAQERETLSDLEGPNMDLFREILTQAKTQVDAWGGQLYFVYLPEWGRYAHYSTWGETKRSSVLTMIESLRIPIIDIEPTFQANGDPLSLFPFRGLGHYTETGHRLVAKEVLRNLPSSNRAGLN
jgi:PAS domain S-box-containing protein